MPGDFTPFSGKLHVSHHSFVCITGSREAETARREIGKDGSESSSMGGGVEHGVVCDLQVLA